MTSMNYTKADQWIVGEDKFNSQRLGKCEAIMSLGNGYMGLRSATEESYLGEKRNLFVAGTFNKFDKDEVTELPNAADLVMTNIEIDGECFSLDQGEIKHYWRQLNLYTGELQRNVTWVSPKGHEMVLDFYRFVSMDNLHVIGQKINVTSVNGDVNVKLISGIDGRMSNSGSQHFSDGDKRFYDKKYMQFLQQTEESKIDFVYNTCLSFTMDDKEYDMDSRIVMERRKIFMEYSGLIKQGQTLSAEKISNVYTSRDLENKGCELKEIQSKSLEALKEAVETGYHKLKVQSAKVWADKIWNEIPVTIESENNYDQLAIRFAQYHLHIMTPAHDNRMNVAAKGMSGEGYKGHTFWDTDIFVLPYFTFTAPQIAKKLEEYRYLSLAGAHKKAKDNAYEGAMFPWESAWLDDGEVTPVWGAADIVTGLPTKIMSGFIEQHITSDVAYGIWQYYQVTGDESFMESCGYELMLDTAKFWASRLEFDEKDGKYHINDVVGPDEYKEGVDDNAFTNYMAYWNIQKAMEFYNLLKTTKPEIFARLNEKLDLTRVYKIWEERKELIFLPKPNENKVIAQDATYLTLKDIDLTKYKNQENVGSMFYEYSLDQVKYMQVSKQADIMILFFLLEDWFSIDVKKANWDYYEARTLHDSSLSLSTHCILANDIGDTQMAYDLFDKASKIDLGPNMKTSDEGIHAASIAGIWQSCVFGFGGVRMLNGNLRINPSLPKQWNKLNFFIHWHGQKLEVTVTKEQIRITNLTGLKEVELEVFGNMYKIKGESVINL